jgi:hypothetical protein
MRPWLLFILAGGMAGGSPMISQVNSRVAERKALVQPVSRTCQLQYLDEIGQKNTWINDKLQYSIRKFRYYKRRMKQIGRAAKGLAQNPASGVPDIQPGDLVRIASAAEIRRTLDRNRKTGGCTFQIGMYDHCGKEYRVLKKVEYFFDETKQKLCKCKNIYLLEGSCCTGTTAYLEVCDRNCFFFWHARWLHRV